MLKRSQHSCLKGKVLDSAPEMKILQGGAKSTEPSDDRSYLLVRIAIVLVSDRQRKEGEKSFKCNQCNFASVRADNLRRQLKKAYKCNHLRFGNEDIQTHSGEKAYKCHQCDFASVQAGKLRTLKLTLEKSTKMQKM